ncbi:hypothetical protein MPSEU_000269400 [Mayamaea pseudoterrestris]|nr:hypothetical protein MPSEU_000269400 [Mayamaea pseudoterrestris]
MKLLSIVLLPSLATSFAIQTLQQQLRPSMTQLFESSEEIDAAATPNELILDTAAVAQQMAGLRSKYPTSEADYLAAARARAAAKAASKNDEATDQDWVSVKQKVQPKEDDDWEISAKEAGNIDSQILIPLMNEDGDDEPKLMLF